jgi:hypothetical protein
MFEIVGLVGKIGCEATGHTLSLVDVTSFLNDRGDNNELESVHAIDGIVQVVSASEDEVKEGVLMPNDLICFFDIDEVNQIKLKNNNKLVYDGKYYQIVQVIREIGHVEVLAKKS